MSKFLDHIMHSLTGNRKMPSFSPYHSMVAETSVDSAISFSPLTQYRVTLYYKNVFHCEPKNLNKMLENIKNELREEMYGDIKKSLMLAERAIYEQNGEEALQHMQNIEKEIYGHPKQP